MTEKLISFKVTTLNGMADGDFQRLLAILIDEKEGITFHSQHWDMEQRGLKRLGFGCYGDVYEFIGSNGYEYAVKICSFKNSALQHDGEILSKLQGIVGFPKLFLYIDGESETSDFMIMVSQKINGFTIAKIVNPWNADKILVQQFKDTFEPEILKIFNQTIRSSFARGLRPDDVHIENVMYDINEKIFYVVDVGKFTNTKFTEVRDNDISSYRNNARISDLLHMVNYKKEVLA
jgi:hypothetical protein